MDRCTASVIRQGEWFGCDVPYPHPGVAHGNLRLEAIWGCGQSPEERAAEREDVTR